MSKHTSGPWTKQTDGKGFFWIDKLTDDGGFSICNCGDGEQAEENSLLIASAPEILEALKICIKRLKCLEESGHGEAIILNAEAAIQKAEVAP